MHCEIYTDCLRQIENIKIKITIVTIHMIFHLNYAEKFPILTMSEPQFTKVSPKYWEEKWDKRKIGFHRSHMDK